jgi:electron transfer flavoprotein beta subunit
MSALRIAVGFKVTPDYEALRPADWSRLAAGTGAPGGEASALKYVRRVLGPFDEAALELALRLRDARSERGLQTGLAAFSIAGREAGPFLTTLRALGFETARVDAGADLGFAPAASAALVAACVRRLGGDVLLLGAQSGPGDSGMVPFLTAETLGRPCVTQVTAIAPLDDGRLRATFAADGGLLRATVAPPCVLAIGNALVSMLRVPTLKDRLAVRDLPTAALTAEELGVAVSAALEQETAALTRLELVDRARAGAVVPGASPQEKARVLYETELRARLERL